jgi:hypothetical protein
MTQEAQAGQQPPPAAADAISHAAPPNTTAHAQEATQAQQSTQASSSTEGQTGGGNVPAASSSPPIAPAKVLLSPTGQPLARDALGRLYNPAKGEPPPKRQPNADLNQPKSSSDNDLERRDTRIGGLDAIPKDWPELPGNVSLGQEIAWVQAERLRVVKEQANGSVKVDLSKARVPAPSMAALSWLETSIRSYAKFVEVASKQASSGQDEAEFVRRERMAIGEIRSILQEMMVDKQG